MAKRSFKVGRKTSCPKKGSKAKRTIASYKRGKTSGARKTVPIKSHCKTVRKPTCPKSNSKQTQAIGLYKRSKKGGSRKIKKVKGHCRTPKTLKEIEAREAQEAQEPQEAQEAQEYYDQAMHQEKPKPAQTESKVQYYRRKAAECKEQGLKYSKLADACVERKKSKAEYDLGSMFGEDLLKSEPEALTYREPEALTYKEPEALTYREPEALTYREPQGLTYREPEALSVRKSEKSIPEQAKSKALKIKADRCRSENKFYDRKNDQCVDRLKQAKKEKMMKAERPRNIELMYEDDCEGFEYPSEDFSSCKKFSVVDTKCPQGKQFHYRKMSCRPEKEKFLKGEYDIELKYDNWEQQQKMYGQQDFAPKYSSFTEAMKASQELEEGY